MTDIKNTLLRLALLLVVGGAGLVSILATNGGNDNQGYAVVYPVLGDGGMNMQVRWSGDGVSWADAGFTQGFGDGNGAALAAVPQKTTFIAAWQDGGVVRALQGLGTGNWNDTPMAVSPGEVARSAPSLVFMEQGKWLVAFRAQSNVPNVGDRMVVRILDTSVNPPRYLERNRFGYPDFANYTLGRPAVAYLDGKVLLAWVTKTVSSKLHLAVGQFEGDDIDWQGHQEFEFTEASCNPLRSDPVLTHDHSRFYLGFLCGNDTLPLTGTSFSVYRSADGLGWSSYGTWGRPPNGIPVGSLIGLAGRADGSLIAAAIARESSPQYFAARCAGEAACGQADGGGWVTVDYQTIFGLRAPDGSFDLIATGRPAE